VPFKFSGPDGEPQNIPSKWYFDGDPVRASRNPMLLRWNGGPLAESQRGTSADKVTKVSKVSGLGVISCDLSDFKPSTVRSIIGAGQTPNAMGTMV